MSIRFHANTIQQIQHNYCAVLFVVLRLSCAVRVLFVVCCCCLLYCLCVVLLSVVWVCCLCAVCAFVCLLCVCCVFVVQHTTHNAQHATHQQFAHTLYPLLCVVRIKV